MSGLARTKENFPALGGSSSSAGGNGSGGGGGGSSGSTRSQPPISNVLKKQPTSATGAIPRNSISGSIPSASAGGMVIHVSNRPSSSNNPTVPSKKANAIDFPALPMGKTKKNQAKQSILEEDMPTSGVKLPMTSVSSKHRSLVDDYVSVANPANFQKIQMVQKEEMESKARKEAEAKNAPKLTSQDFPSLGGSSSAKSSSSNSWIKSTMSEKKQKDLENRKNKIAPAPLLPKNNSSPKAPSITNGNNQNNVLNNKKDKKTKDKKSKETNNNNNNENKSTNNTMSNGNNNQSPLRPPPGFQNSNASVKPPPGFQTNVTVNSVAKSPNNLTFTSSLGESYSILPAHSYTAPPDALARNQVSKLYILLYHLEIW